MSRAIGPCMSKSAFLAAWLLVILVIAPLSTAQDSDDLSDEGVLKGVVHNLHYDSPVPNAYILVESSVGYKEARSTNEDGEYRFHLPYGTYSLRAFVRDQEVANATGIYVDPSPVVHDILISFDIEEPVRLNGVIKMEGEKVVDRLVSFEGLDNSYRNETRTGDDGSYSLDVPYGNLLVTVYEEGEVAGSKRIGPFVEPGPNEVKMDIVRTGDAPSVGEWTDFFVTTWTGIAIWGGVIFVLIFLYAIIGRRLLLWIDSKDHNLSQELVEMIAYALKGYMAVGFLHISLLTLDAFLDISDQTVATFIRFWLLAFEVVLILWVTARLFMKAIDYLMIRLRKRRVAEGGEVPETAYIFLHGMLRYLVITIFGFFILLTILSGLGLYDEISGGFFGFIDTNFGYLLLLVIIVILFFVTNRFVKLTLNQMRVTSKRFSPQMIGIFGLIARIAIIGLFSVLFIFTLLTMAGMQEMGALIMALLTTSIGMIVAMTTTGAIGNALSGMVLMTLKPIEPGQYVLVADDQFGKVIEVSTFFTRLRTYRNEVIEVPNNLVMAMHITNFSRNEKIGIEVEMGISYDIPTDRVLDLLKNGAKGTSSIVRDPKPQAMVTTFGDYAIHYMLRAYTDDMERYHQTKSSLMQNLQELFYTEGIEIMTPWQIMKREDTCPDRDEVVRRYAEQLKHKDHREVDGLRVAAGMSMLDGDDTDSC